MALELVLIGLGLAATVATAIGSDARARKRSLRALYAMPRLGATSIVGSNVVEIGHVRPTSPELDAPLSGRPCVAFCASAYHGGGVFKHARIWLRAGIVPFELEREDGTRVIVESPHVWFLFPPLPLPADAPDRCQEFAIAVEVPPKLRKKLGYEEILVIEGMRIAVAGRLIAPARDDEPARIGGTNEQPVVIAVPF